MRKSLTFYLDLFRKAIAILVFRFRVQGLRTTILWLWVRGTNLITGIPSISYSQIEDNLYVGPQYRQMGRGVLARAGITASVNMRSEFDDAAHGLDFEHYCHLPTVDDTAPTIEQLDLGVAFIRGAIEQGRKVYIHCAGGIGRAPTMAAAYLIDQGIALEEAVKAIQKVRPFINIVPEQMEQLRLYASGVRPS
jgi:protein-tyrosine phosphatase